MLGTACKTKVLEKMPPVKTGSKSRLRPDGTDTNRRYIQKQMTDKEQYMPTALKSRGTGGGPVPVASANSQDTRKPSQAD